MSCCNINISVMIIVLSKINMYQIIRQYTTEYRTAVMNGMLITISVGSGRS